MLMATPDPLEAFAARALDWPAVRDQLLIHAPSALGRRALVELCPRDEEGARAALGRTREVLSLPEGEREPPLDGGYDPLPPLRRALEFGRVLAGEELYWIGAFLRRVEEVHDWLRARREQLPMCAALWEDLPDLSGLRERVEATVDRRGHVLDDATPELRTLRRAIESTGREVERRIKKIANRPGLRATLADGQAGAIHRRSGRMVLAVRAKQSGRLPGIVHDRSQSGETVFIEPQEVIELANSLAALQSDEEHEVQRILADWTRRFVEKRHALERTAGRVAELELAVLSARFARRTGGRPAHLPGEPGAATGLLLRSMRHPLLLVEQEKGKLDEVVPLDLRLGEDFDLLVVTGPNTGGKTLALKTAGLAALLTRLGLALPCDEGTTVPLYDGIVADIGDEQEIQQNLSTFSSHLKRIQDGLVRATPRTLFLLDELGGGTDPDEGAALGDALLERLHTERVPTLASTHLGKLKEFAFRHRRAENAHVEFDLETLGPRYRLVIGAPGQSRALAIARRLGFAEDVLVAADARLERRSDEVQALMAGLRDVRIETERKRSEAEARLAGVAAEERGLADREQDLTLRRDQLEAEAQRGLEERLSKARAQADRARAFLDRVPKAVRGDLAEIVGELEDALGDALMTERRRSFLAGLKKGVFVWLPRYKKRCAVARIWRERKQLDVRLGKTTLTVDFDDVTFYESL